MQFNLLTVVTNNNPLCTKCILSYFGHSKREEETKLIGVGKTKRRRSCSCSPRRTPQNCRPRSTAQTPIVDNADRAKNVAYNNFRGIVGFFPPVLILPWFFELGKHDKTVILMWVCMLWMFFWQPSSIQACGLIPLFVLPMCGVVSSAVVVQCYFNDITALFIIGSMMHLLLNNSGVDRRIAIWFLCAGNTSQFSALRSGPKGMEYPDIFNYLQYCCYAIPTALVMFLCNVFYHMALILRTTRAPFSDSDMAEVKKLLLEQKKVLPEKMGTHEKLTLIFATLAMLTFIFRWCVWLNMGWATFRREAVSPLIPGIKDATVAAIYIFILHLLPRTLGFMRFLTAKSAGVSLNIAVRNTDLCSAISAGSGKLLTDYVWCLSLLLVVFIAIFLANIMPGVASCCLFLPFVINMAVEPDAPVPWPKRVYIGALGVGVASSMTFMFPFLNTPAYFCNTTGKVPRGIMAKYSFPSVIICGIIIWLSLCYWAPIVWDPNGEGISPVPSPTGNNTTQLL
ncbi:hypothetical protein RR46_09950 [Papilio xuthus]|uniref:Protein I'm not dead yet n=1 Tax=Papilio xuthus TaxID=66420 RepID=A0A194QBA9_PAPXU|nr:hypothetical protein RR46_09950 [Papilio xuthus]